MGEISVSTLARAAGVTRVTFYHHFRDRDELLQAAGVDRFRDALEQPATAGGGLESATRRLFEQLDSDPALYRRLLSGECGIGMSRAIEHYIAERIARAEATIRPDGFTPGEVEFLAGGAMALLHHWTEAEPEDQEPPGVIAARISRLIGHGGPACSSDAETTSPADPPTS